MEFRKVVRDGVEYRFDPLTGEQCRINPERAKRLKQSGGGAGLREIVPMTRERCPFCSERLERETPVFPGDTGPQGRVKLGETSIFPNLNPVGENNAVAVISRAHFLDLDEFSSLMLQDNLTACSNYIFSVHEKDEEAVWPVWLWNYMPPSAGSIIHPHSQVLVEREPLPVQARILQESREYYEQNGRNYWDELAERERELGERFIYGNDSLSVIASFAPRGFNEIQFIFRELSSLVGLGEKEIANFVDCLIRALNGYKKLGIGSFNLLSFSGPVDERLDYYRLSAKLISRPYPCGIYTNDAGPFEKLADTRVIDTLPEMVAGQLRPSYMK
jgi:UDPglucose--hexose-1-phosphate uridylyltransferase